MKKVALVHDWMIHMRGGEKVLSSLAEIYPEATLYTLFCDKAKLSVSLQKLTVKTSFLQWVPGIRSLYRWLLPILPLVIRTLHVKEADIVISSSHCVAKAIHIPKNAQHFCYCHTPMRYVWGFEDEYFGKFPRILRPLISGILAWVRFWDLRSNQGVDHFIANSDNVRKRIKKYYNRNAEVIYPPLDSEVYFPEDNVEDYYLVVSAFVPYKRVDLVIEAFNRMEKKLIVVGSGPLERSYRSLAKSPRIIFKGRVSDKDLRMFYARARATIFPTDEDFGIVPLESQSCGTPVIAYASGGALESVKTGVFFKEQTVESLCEAVREFESEPISRGGVREKVQSFGKDQFKEKIQHYVENRECVPEVV